MTFETGNRELCPDDGCVGLIGPDGRCKECGTVGDSAHTHSRLRGMRLDGDDEPAADDDDRELCPDGGCIGLIGPDGRCKECGRAGERPVATIAPLSTSPAAPPPAVPDGDADSDDIEHRELCPDGMCIGVIGADGRCKVCGAAAK